jgi:hypothetical protein
LRVVVDALMHESCNTIECSTQEEAAEGSNNTIECSTQEEAAEGSNYEDVTEPSS